MLAFCSGISAQTCVCTCATLASPNFFVHVQSHCIIFQPPYISMAAYNNIHYKSKLYYPSPQKEKKIKRNSKNINNVKLLLFIST